MEWQQWPSVAFGDRQLLPACSGIYVIADDHHCVWYVGQAVDLQSRWLGKGHHRYPQLIRTNRKLKHQIYWQAFSAHQLNEQERFYIDLLKPDLNGCKVKTYLPKQPQVEREIKRLFKALNRPTMLFPVFVRRSLVSILMTMVLAVLSSSLTSMTFVSSKSHRENDTHLRSKGLGLVSTAFAVSLKITITLIL